MTVSEMAGSPITGSETARNRLIELMDRYEQRLYAFLVVLSGDPEVADDCAQETFLRAYQNLMKGKPVNAQWLYKVARHRAIDEFHHRPAHVGLEQIDDLPSAPPSESAETVAVRRALARLSPEDREVLYLARVDRFKAPDIATMLGIRPGAVRVRLHRAHARFQHAYGEEG